MTNKTTGIFTRISILVFLIITVLSALFIIITYLASFYFYEASTQLLDKDVAKHIAQFTSPFENNGINKKKADTVFHNTMVLNPSSEVYFLDTAGNVIYYESPDTTIIELHKIPLDDIREFINSEGESFVTGYNPKDGSKKIFSAAEVFKNNKLLGYIYVILGSKKYGTATGMLFGSHALTLALIAFSIVIIISVFISASYIKMLQRNYKKIIMVLGEYSSGNFLARFNLKDNNEFAPITKAFNNLTNILSANMQTLQKSEADRKDLIATISHDLQSPLSVAKGYAEILMLQDGKTIKPEHHDYLKLIQLKITQVEKMVTQLAEISKMDEINFKPQKEPFVLSEIIEETVNTYQLNASEKKVDLTCSQCEYHLWVEGDVSMMERVMQNLIDNAVKNTASGGRVEILVSTENEFLVVLVKNNGKLLSPELFKWINTEDEELAERPSHTGLGLLIVKKILRLHNSILQVYIDKDENVFNFKMPIVQQPALTL